MYETKQSALFSNNGTIKRTYFLLNNYFDSSFLVSYNTSINIYTSNAQYTKYTYIKLYFLRVFLHIEFTQKSH